MVQWLRQRTSNAGGIWVQSLVRELRFRMLLRMVKKKISKRIKNGDSKKRKWGAGGSMAIGRTWKSWEVIN